MNIDIAAPHFTLTDGVREYVERRFGPLNRFNDRMTRTSIVLDRVTAHHASAAYVVKAHTNLPHETANVEAQSEDLYAAVDAAADKLSAKLRKAHEKNCDRH